MKRVDTIVRVQRAYYVQKCRRCELLPMQIEKASYSLRNCNCYINHLSAGDVNLRM